jgi:adenylate cyclase
MPNSRADSPDSPDSPDRIRAELSRIIESPAFSGSDRNRRFLAFVVEETLAGRANRIKAYTIATTVFGREETFDAQSDSIVRIEAGRLRRALEHYYLTAGVGNPIRILLPRGTYAPVFVSGKDPPVAAPVQRTLPSPNVATKPVVLVLDVVDESAEPLQYLASGLTRQIVVGLTRFTQLRVFGQQTLLALSTPGDLARIREEFGVNFIVTGSVYHVNGQVKLNGLLIDAQSGRSLWAETFVGPCEPSGLLSIRDGIAENVVRNLAQPWGVISTTLAAETRNKPVEDRTAFDAIIFFCQYQISFDPALYGIARTALEGAVKIDPNFAEAWACLSRLQTDAMRFSFRVVGDPSPTVMLERAVKSAQRAVGLAPRSSQSFQALGFAYWFKGDVEGGLAALSTAVSLNPHDTEALVNLGIFRCLRMDWDDGVPLILAAYECNPALPANYHIGLGLWHFAQGRMREAHDEAMRMSGHSIFYRHLLIAVSAHGLGRKGEAREAISAMLKIDPSYGARIEESYARKLVTA